MQGRGVRAAAYDIGIAPVIGVAEFEDTRDLSVDFVFPLRPGGGDPCALVRFNTDIDRVLKYLEFHCGFSCAHFREYWCDRFNSYARNRFPFVRKALLLAILAALAPVRRGDQTKGRKRTQIAVGRT